MDVRILHAELLQVAQPLDYPEVIIGDLYLLQSNQPV